MWRLRYDPGTDPCREESEVKGRVGDTGWAHCP